VAVALLVGCTGSAPPAGPALVAAPPAEPLALPGVLAGELSAQLCLASDDHDVEKRHAATLLGMLAASEGLPCLHQALRSEPSASVRAAAARALGEIGSPQSLPELLTGLDDGEPEVRVAVAGALGRFNTGTAVSALRKLAAGAGPEALAALQALAHSPLGRAALSEVEAGPPGRFETTVPEPSELDPKTWYVDASEGSDDGPGTAAQPFRTLKRACRELRGGAGDTVFATSGSAAQSFHEEVVVPTAASGTADRPTIIAAWPGRPPPVLDGARDDKPGAPGLGTGVHVEASFVHLRELIVRHYVDNGIQVVGSTGNVLIDCTVERCDRHGIFAYYSPRTTIVRPRVRLCFKQGISLRSSPQTAVLGGRSDDNGIDGLLLLHNSDDVLIDHFSASGNQRGIALTRGSNDARILGSNLQGNQEHDLAIGPGCSASLIETTAESRSRP
jgi:parallel beta-helix repeat protein